MIEMQFVSSSNVEQIGYDPDLSELHIKHLRSPAVYVYLNVPLQIWEGLLAAPSKGIFLGSEVKNVYQFEKR